MASPTVLSINGRLYKIEPPHAVSLIAGFNAAGVPVGLLLANDGSIGATLTGSLAAGENIIGKVVGSTVCPTSTPTFSVGGAYATGDYAGTTTTPQAFTSVVRTSGGTGVLQSITITDKLATAAVDLELWLFSATFTAPTDNAAWDITDAHALLCLGVVPIPSTSWYASSSNKVATVRNIGLPIKPAATSLFYALVARGTTPAWATGDVLLALSILQD